MRWPTAVAVFALGALFAGSATAENEASWRREQIEHLISFRGDYRNEQYGYGVQLPRGVRAYRSKAPNPNHGFLVLLGHRRTITVSAFFDAMMFGSTKAQLDSSIEDARAEHVERSPATLAGNPAEKAVLGKGDVVITTIVQRRDEDGGILYELTLNTTRAHQAEDARVFDRVVSGFQEFARPGAGPGR
jgi:hypothetical protein